MEGMNRSAGNQKVSILETKHKNELETSWQQMQALADNMPGADRFKRSEVDGRKLIENENGEKYSIERLSEGDREQLKRLGQELHDFNSEFFDPEENDRAEDYQVALEKNLSDFYAVRDGEGKIVSLLNSQSITTSIGGTTPEDMLLVWYVSTDKSSQKRGLGTELYRQAYADFIQRSKKKNSKTIGVCGETETEVEGYLNKTYDRKRAYYKKSDGSLAEVPYRCAPSFEDETPAPGHLMFKFGDGRIEMTREELLRTVGAIYSEYKRTDYAAIDSQEETRQYNGLVDGLYIELEKQLESSQNDQILLLGETEKQRLRTSGTKILELKK